LGDLLTAVPAVRALRDAYPGHRLVLAAPEALAPLAHLSGAVDEVVDTAPLASLSEALAGAELAVNLHGRGPQSHRVLLGARPQRLIAFAHADVPETTGGPAGRASEHETMRWCRLLEESGVPADPGRLDLPAPAGAPSHRGARGATLLHPGAASPARRWPPERFAAVARAERERGRTVLVSGSADERSLAEDVVRRAELPAEAVEAGTTDLLGLARLVAAAGRLVCGDTGIAHLATALGTPSVVLFGPTSPAQWGPPDDRPYHRALWSGRSGDPHAGLPDPGLLELGVEDVLAALRALPETASERRSTVVA
jgi:ADP-heptose:LPS heptosyltransferase